MADLSLLEKFNTKHERNTVFKDYMRSYNKREYGYTDSISYENALQLFTGKEISKIIEMSKHLFRYGNSNDLQLIKSVDEQHIAVRRIIMYNIELMRIKEEYSELKQYIDLHKKLFQVQP